MLLDSCQKQVLQLETIQSKIKWFLRIPWEINIKWKIFERALNCSLKSRMIECLVIIKQYKFSFILQMILKLSKSGSFNWKAPYHQEFKTLNGETLSSLQ